MGNRVDEIIAERKMIEAEKDLNRRHYRDCLNEAAKAEKTAQAWRVTAQKFVDTMAAAQEKFYQLGNELEELTGSKRIK